jgi:hypothetical protein
VLPRRLAGFVLLAGLSGTVGAHAEEAPLQRARARYYFRLNYRVAPGLHGCLSRPEVRELLAGQLDYDAIRQDDGPGQIGIDISRRDGKVQARLSVDGAGEHWEATLDKASTCEDVTLDALVTLNAAVTVLILIPMQEQLPVPAPTKAPPAPPAAPPPCAPVVEPPSIPPPPVPRALPEPRRVELGLASIFAAGVAPVVTGGVGWTIGLRWPQASAAVEGRVLFAPSAEIDRADLRGSFQFVFAAASGSACFYPWAAWAFACARVEVGALSLGFSGPYGYITSSLPAFVGVGLRLGGDHVVRRGLALRAYVEVLAHPQSGNLLLVNKGDPSLLWPGSVVSGSIGFGPVVSFSGP